MQPLGGGLAGSDGSWGPVLAVRVESRDSRREHRECRRGDKSRQLDRRRGEREGCHATASARTKLACRRMPTRARFRGRVAVGMARMVVSSLVLSGCAVLALHIVLPVGGTHSSMDRRRLARAKHGGGHCATNGQQDGQQDQNEGAEMPHGSRLSDRGSVRAAQHKFPLIGAASHPWARRAPSRARRLLAEAGGVRASACARPSRIGHSGRSSPWQQCTKCSSADFMAKS